MTLKPKCHFSAQRDFTKIFKQERHREGCTRGGCYPCAISYLCAPSKLRHVCCQDGSAPAPEGIPLHVPCQGVNKFKKASSFSVAGFVLFF